MKLLQTARTKPLLRSGMTSRIRRKIERKLRGVERLEDRALLTNDVTFYLDFTPDAATPDNNALQPGPMSEIFNLAYWQNELHPSPTQPSPLNNALWDQNSTDSSGRLVVANKARLLSLLDFNEDGSLDSNDYTGSKGAQQKILQVSRGHFRNVAKSVKAANGTSVRFRTTANAWQKLLDSSISSADTFVMYIGNDNSSTPAIPTLPEQFVYGISAVAPPQTNYEYYGYVFAGEVVKRIIQHNGPDDFNLWTPTHFVNFVATTASHELGHELGLRHVLVARKDSSGNIVGYRDPGPGRLAGSLMSYGRERWANNARFENRTYSYVGNVNPTTGVTTILTGGQNAYQELRNSLGLLGGHSTESLVASGVTPYFDSGHDDDLRTENPIRSNPPPVFGTAAGKTAATIAAQLVGGFDLLRTQHVTSIANALNLPTTSLPFVSGQLAGLLNVGVEFGTVMPSLNLTGAATMSDIRGRLEAQGFIIDQIVTDLATLNPNAPADFVRASRAFSLAGLGGTTTLSTTALSGLSDLVGINIAAQMHLLADAVLHLTVGVDTNGFYLLPGLLLDAAVTARGELSTALGAFGDAAGEATVMIRPNVELGATAADGRVRLASLDPSVLTTSIEGVAAVTFDFKVKVVGQETVDFTGRWLWDIDDTGFTYVTDESGFDEELLLDSLADKLAEGVNSLVGLADRLGPFIKDVPVIGETLASKLSDELRSVLAVNANEEDLPLEKLAAHGLQVEFVPGLSPRSFIDGTYLNAPDLLRATFHKTYTPPIGSFRAEGDFDLMNDGVPVGGHFAGDVVIDNPMDSTDDPSLELQLAFGIDAINGAFLLEQSFIRFDFTSSVALAGTAHVGPIIELGAMANATFGIDARLVIDDFDGQPGEKVYLPTAIGGTLIDSILGDPKTLSVVGDARLALTLSATNPAVNIPIIGEIIADVLPTFDWHAEALFHFAQLSEGGYESTATYTVRDTEQELEAIFDQVGEALFRESFLDQLETFNPLPADFRTFLTADLAILGERSLVDLMGMEEIEILLNPSAITDSGNVTEDSTERDKLELTIDIVETPLNIIKLLSGQLADLVSLEIDKTFSIFQTAIPLVPETPLFTFFGIVGVNGKIDIVADLSFGVKVTVGLDTDGFYVRNQPDLFTVTGDVSLRPKLSGEILHVIEFASVTGSIGVEVSGKIGIEDRAVERIRELRFPNVFTIGADLVFSLDGSVGLSDIDNCNTLCNTFDIFDKTIPLFERQLTEPGQDVFAAAKDKMREEGNKLALCGAGVVASTFVPGVGPAVGAVACAVAYREEIIQAIVDGVEWVGDRWDDVVDSAQELGDRAVDWANDRLEDISNELARFDAQVLQPLLTLIKSGLGIGDALDQQIKNITGLTDAFSGSQYESHSITPRQNFTHYVQDETLYVRWDEDRSAELFIGIGEGQVFVDGDNFVRNEQVATKKTKYRCDIRGCFYRDREPVYRDVTHENVAVYDVGMVRKIEIRGGQHSDKLLVQANVNVPVEIHSFDGGDTIGGGSGDDTFYGGAGDDRIFGGGGADKLYGEDDHDTVGGGLGDDTLDGGSGDDYLDEESEPGDRSSEANVLFGSAGIDTLVGSPGGDTMDGGSLADVLRGHGGADELYGGGDDDNLAGGSGEDSLYGGLGNDLMDGGSEGDHLFGGDNDDRIIGGSGTDAIHGDSGSDALDGGEHRDSLFGGRGADRLDGGDGGDLLVGAIENAEDDPLDGNDFLIGGVGDDTLKGGRGGATLAQLPMGGLPYDYLDGGDHDDVLEGGSGPDHLRGGAGRDTISGAGDADTILGDSGADDLRGDGGTDFIMASATADGETGSVVNGGDEKDFIVGSRGRDTLHGGADDDEIHGGFLDDDLFGDGGHDLLNANQGDDNVFGGADTDTVTGELGNDVLNGGDDFDIIKEDADTSFILTDVSLEGLGTDQLVEIEKATLFGRQSNNQFTVRSWSKIAELDGRGDADSYRVDFVGRGSGLTDINDSGATVVDSVVVNGTSDVDIVFVNSREVARATETVRFADTESLTLNAGAENDIVDVQSTSRTNAVFIRGNSGDDQVTVGIGDLNAITGGVDVQGNDGSNDVITVNDAGVSLLVDYLVTPVSVDSVDSPKAVAGQPVRTFGGVRYDETSEFLRLDGSEGANVFDVQPSVNTEYFMDGNPPDPMSVCTKEGDYLMLDTKTTFPPHPQGLDTSGRKLTLESRGSGHWSFTKTAHKRLKFESMERFNHVDIMLAGADAGRFSRPLVQVFDAETADLKFEVLSTHTFGDSYRDGVRVAAGDLNNDGLPDVIVGPGRNAAAEIKVFDGAPMAGIQGTEIMSSSIPATATYGSAHLNGAQLAVGDVVGDCLNDIVVVPSRGPSEVRVFENRMLPGPPFATTNLVPARIFNAFADSPTFIGGATVSVGDLDGIADGNEKQDIVVASGSGMPGVVRVFDVSVSASNVFPIRQINDPNPSARGGLNVALGDINGDTIPDLITGAGPAGDAWVRAYDGLAGSGAAPIISFQAFTDLSRSAPVRVAVGDINGDGVAEILAAQGPDGRNNYQVTRVLASPVSLIDSFILTGSDFSGGGVFLGSSSEGIEPPRHVVVGASAAPQNLAGEYMSGDVNRDGIVDRLDLVFVLQHQFTRVGMVGFAVSADFDGNGLINLRDAIAIRNQMNMAVGSASGLIAEQTGSALNDRGRVGRLEVNSVRRRYVSRGGTVNTSVAAGAGADEAPQGSHPSVRNLVPAVRSLRSTIQGSKTSGEESMTVLDAAITALNADGDRHPRQSRRRLI